MLNLAIACRNQGRYEVAESNFLLALDTRRKVLGPDHPDTLRVKMNLAILRDKQTSYHEAEFLYRQVLEVREQKLGLKHRYTLRTAERLVSLLWTQGRYSDAETLASRIVQLTDSKTLEPPQPPHHDFLQAERLFQLARAPRRESPRPKPRRHHRSAHQPRERLRSPRPPLRSRDPAGSKSQSYPRAAWAYASRVVKDDGESGGSISAAGEG
jgi:tetratricopeptide (TPR) repeat protein